jgi:arginyl-tRNA synthetase
VFWVKKFEYNEWVEITDKLKRLVSEAAGVASEEIKLEHPEREEFGDYAFFKAPRSAAEEIAAKIKPDDLIERVSVAGGGFVNISLRIEYLVSVLEGLLIQGWEENKYLANNSKTVIIDYSAPNIAKYFGIGHLRSTIIGQSLYNIYKKLGYQVIGDNHLGDWGMQFGKLLYMIEENKNIPISLDNLEKWYVEFHRRAKTDPQMEEEAKKWFLKLEQGDQEARVRWRKCVEVSLAEYERIYRLLGVIIDYTYGESTYEELMTRVIAEAKDKQIAYESEGAWVIDTGTETPLMLLKSDGGTTYATRDLATIKFRQEKWNPDIYIYEVGAEQALHFTQVFVAARKLGYINDGVKMVHTRHGLYLGTDGKKFKTRAGNTVRLEEVFDEAIDRAKKLGNSDENTARAVGVGAIKYFDLMHNVGSDIVFDWEKVMNLEGNSGPYLQYTYARTQSVLAKSNNTPLVFPPKLGGKEKGGINPEELRVLKWIYRFPEVVEEAAERFAPNLICNFLYELAQRFNGFYNKHSILGKTSPVSEETPSPDSGEGWGEVRSFRLALTAGVGKVMKEGLELLGIEALSRM